MEKYRRNLETVFNRLDATLPGSCLVIWSMTMPLGRKLTGGFLGPEVRGFGSVQESGGKGRSSLLGVRPKVITVPCDTSPASQTLVLPHQMKRPY